MPYVITGGSGYLGSRLVDLLSRREDTERIVICDVPAPRENKPKSQFERLGVRDRDGVRAVLDRARPDALVHLAFILTPVHDEAVEHPGELARAGASASRLSTCSTATSTRWSRSGSRWRPPRRS